MQPESPVRWGGLAALLAGALIALSELLRLYIDLVDPALYRSVFPFDGALGLLLAVLVQLGLVGLYARQARSVGTLGLVGFVLAFIGVQLSMGTSFVDAFAKPVIMVSKRSQHGQFPAGPFRRPECADCAGPGRA